jgi:dienelactone hydrolase
MKKLIEPSRLPRIPGFPDPLTRLDGSRVTTGAHWEKRRRELKALFQYYEYGHLPPGPQNVKARLVSRQTIYRGTATVRTLHLCFGPQRGLSLDLMMYIPKKRKGPFPVIVTGDLCWPETRLALAGDYIKRGYIIAEFDRTRLDADNANPFDGAQALYPKYDWGTLGVWAWAYHRVVDYLVTDKLVDAGKIALTGHSRGGKTVLLAAALDERIALVCPNGSGTCGVGPIRYRYTGESIDDITRTFPYWFNKRFQKFKGKNRFRLPVDQHELIALVAPRAFLTTIATGDLWCNPHGSQMAWLAAREVYRFLGAQDKCGIWYREGIHEHGKKDWDALADFCDMIFFGKKTKRNFCCLPYNPSAKPADT